MLSEEGIGAALGGKAGDSVLMGSSQAIAERVAMLELGAAAAGRADTLVLSANKSGTVALPRLHGPSSYLELRYISLYIHSPVRSPCAASLRCSSL
jgi:hypothetical protein